MMSVLLPWIEDVLVILGVVIISLLMLLRLQYIDKVGNRQKSLGMRSPTL